MAKMKNLLLNLHEFKDEIEELLTNAREVTPTAFSLLFDEDLPTKSMYNYFKEFTNDKELIWLTISVIEMDLVKFFPLRLSINSGEKL